MPRPSTARRAGRSIWPGWNSTGPPPARACRRRRARAAFHGDVSRHPRTPARQRDESPWNPGLPPASRERRANHSASTRDCTAVSRPAGSHSGSVRWLPWVAITAPPLTCPVALRPVRPTFLGTCKICIPCNGISCPAEAGMCEPLRSRSRRARATALPRVARAPRYGVSARPFRRLCSREPAPTRPVWQGRFPLP